VETGYNDGFTAYDSANYEMAITLLSRVVRHDEKYVNAWYYLARAYHRLERFDEALATYNKVLEIAEPNSDRARDAQTYIDRITSNQ
jgi:tetratricopeptide (TPR) repeat protein